MKKLIEIDTNGDNHHKFPNNLELFDLIAPRIVAAIADDYEVFTQDDFEYDKIREGLVNSDSLHCIYCHKNQGGGYTSAADFRYLIVEIDEKLRWIESLSELCDEIAETNNISSWNPKRD